MRPINASDADNATRARTELGRRPAKGRLPFRFAEGQPCAVGEQDNVLGQQKVNKAAPRHSTRLELFQLNQAGQPAIPNSDGRSPSTLNPKVEGSNPSRPICRSKSGSGFAGAMTTSNGSTLP